jgi:hypothetical protein
MGDDPSPIIRPPTMHDIEVMRLHEILSVTHLTVALSDTAFEVAEIEDLPRLVQAVVDERDRLREQHNREARGYDRARRQRERAWVIIRQLEAERDQLRADLDRLRNGIAADMEKVRFDQAVINAGYEGMVTEFDALMAGEPVDEERAARLQAFIGPVRNALEEEQAERDSRRVAAKQRVEPLLAAAREFAATQDAWLEQVKSGAPVRSTDEVATRRAAATATLLLHIRMLDEDEQGDP